MGYTTGYFGDARYEIDETADQKSAYFTIFVKQDPAQKGGLFKLQIRETKMQRIVAYEKLDDNLEERRMYTKDEELSDVRDIFQRTHELLLTTYGDDPDNAPWDKDDVDYEVMMLVIKTMVDWTNFQLPDAAEEYLPA